METPTELMAHTMPVLPGRGISHIRVIGLFGQYNYDLEYRLGSGYASKALLLYGDNGSGKTTILRILFHLLNHIDSKGHKTEVAKTRFKEFAIEFSDGTDVVASRTDLRETQYRLTVRREGREVASSIYPSRPLPQLAGVSPEQALELARQKDPDEAGHKQVLASLEQLQLGLIYLTDDRKVLSTASEGTEVISTAREFRIRDTIYLNTVFGNAEPAENRDVTRAVEQISSWATRQAFKGSTQGEEDVNTVYGSVIQRLATSTPPTNISLEDIVVRLRKQASRAVEFVRFGLTKPVQVTPIIDAVLSAPTEYRLPALSILEPYVASLEKRLDALDPIRLQLASFVDLTNSFFGKSKTLYLNVNDGMRIVAANGDQLKPDVLSSGEGQLLYLLASIVVAKERAHLFLIDEPEISLNVRWQRKLVQALLDLTSDAMVQFVLATHSIELLTRFDDCVLQLDHRPDLL